MPDANTTQLPKKRDARSLLLRTAVLGAVLAVLIIGIDLAGYCSRFRVFKKIQLGMATTDAVEILRQYEIYCDTPPSSRGCLFDDYWRLYEIRFSEPQHIVTRKTFVYKHRKDSIVFRASR